MPIQGPDALRNDSRSGQKATYAVQQILTYSITSSARSRNVSGIVNDVEVLSNAGTAERLLRLAADEIVDASELVEEPGSEIIRRV
jgi:hypothetical protein